MIRKQLAAGLKAVLPAGWRVSGYPREPITVRNPTVLLWQSAVVPFLAGDEPTYRCSVELWLLTPVTDPVKADDALDDILDDLLSALDAYPALTWDRAERSTLNEKYHGYRITAEAAAKRGT